MQSRLDEYVPEAVYKLLAHYNKALDANTIAAAMDMAGATDYFIPPRVKLKMKVLIELPANEFDALPNTTEVPEVDEAGSGCPLRRLLPRIARSIFLCTG